MEKAVYNLNRNVKKSPPEEVLIISLLLDNIVISKEIANSNALDFSRFFKLASKHKILPLICNKIITLNLIHELPAQYAQKVKNTIITATVVHTDFKEKLFTFSKIMKKNSIDFLVLKGFAIDKCPFRTMNDLDVLVKNDEIDKIFEVLEKENYKYVGSNVLSKKELNNPKLQYKWNNQFQFKVPNDNIVIEVHTNLFERDRIRLEDLSSLLDNVDVFWKNKKWDNDLQCFLPSIEATLALLCVHTATKRSPSANTFILRQTFDILCILNKDLNYKYFKELCRIWHIEYYVYFSLLLTFNIFNKENCTSLLYYFEKELTSSEKLLAAVHLRSFRGLGNASLFYRKVYAFLMPFVIGNGFYKSIKWYLKVLFPPIWNQEKKFGIKRTSPLIYLTYIYGPFIQLYLLITGKYYK